MPSKKRKYNARFPAGRIKKIMQTDEEVGKVAQAVPVIISRTLELFVESLLTKAMEVTNAKNAKTLSPSHMKQCILSENRFDFLKDLVKNIPDINNEETGDIVVNSSPINNDLIVNKCLTTTKNNNDESSASSSSSISPSNTLTNVQLEASVNTNFSANFYTEQPSKLNSVTPSPSASVIQYTQNVDNSSNQPPPMYHLNTKLESNKGNTDIPPLIPLIKKPNTNNLNNYCSPPSDNLCIDEDYDN